MPQSLRGQFLVAAKHLRDSNFFKSVVLMVEHGTDGAMGIVVNRPSSITVAHALSEHFHLPETDDLVYVGGPVEPQSLFIVHNAVEFVEEDDGVVPGLFVGGNADVFESVVRSACAATSQLDFRIYCGCAGWAPGQLEGELQRGDWFVRPADRNLALCEDPYRLWDILVEQVRAAGRILPDSTENPEWN